MDHKESRLCIEAFSGLPDDILIKVISFLTMKEATHTSLLSTRWRYLWTKLTLLDFDGEDLLLNRPVHDNSLIDATSKYVDRVHQICSSNQAPGLLEFSVKFLLDNSHANHIDQWIEYALKKGARKIELLLCCSYGLPESSARYILSDDFMLNRPWVSSGIKMLKSLKLKLVNISGGLVEQFLASCPNLEHISIHQSMHLQNLKIDGRYLALRSLDIFFCENLSILEIICAPNLVSLGCQGAEAKLLIGHTPALSQVTIGGEHETPVSYGIDSLLSKLSQLVSLKLWLPINEQDPTQLTVPVQLTSLKELSIEVWGSYSGGSLLFLSSIMKKAPFLEKLRLETSKIFSWKESSLNYRHLYHYKCLKVLEIRWFQGAVFEVEFIFHIVRNAVKLEKIVLEMAGVPALEEGRRISSSFIRKIIPERVEVVVVWNEHVSEKSRYQRQFYY